jgi:hypothetical protein
MLCWDTASHALHDPGSLKFERFGEAGGTVGPYTAPNVRNGCEMSFTRDFGIVRQVQSLPTRTLKGGERRTMNAANSGSFYYYVHSADLEHTVLEPINLA